MELPEIKVNLIETKSVMITGHTEEYCNVEVK